MDGHETFYQVLAEQKLKDFYFIEGRESWPSSSIQLDSSRVDSSSLWSEFHFNNFLFFLPHRDPRFQTAPLVRMKEGKRDWLLKIYSDYRRPLIEVLFLPSRDFAPFRYRQNLFKIPIADSLLRKRSEQKIYQDVFGLKNMDFKTYEQGLYKLFVKDLRHQYFPAAVKSVYRLKNKQAFLFELKSNRGDIDIFYYSHFHHGKIYSLVFQLSEFEPHLARSLLALILDKIEVREKNYSLYQIIFREFELLPLNRRLSIEGILHLMGSYSQSFRDRDVFQRVISTAEQMKDLNFLLEEYYPYALEEFGSTLAQKNISGLRLASRVELKRKLDLEQKETFKREEVLKKKPKKRPVQKTRPESLFERLKKKTIKKKNFL